MATYSISAPDGKTYRLDGPDGATQSEVEAEVIKQNPHLAFQTTEGGAATGNPLAAQKYGGPKDTSRIDPLAAIGGAGAIGTVMGVAAPEILQGLSVATRGVPQLNAVSTGLGILSQGARQAGRMPSALSGGVSGLSSETSGQVAEQMGASQPVAEVARLAGGAVTPELAPLALKLTKLTGTMVVPEKAMFFLRNIYDKVVQGKATPGELKLLADVQSDVMGDQVPGRAMQTVGEAMKLGKQRPLVRLERLCCTQTPLA